MRLHAAQAACLFSALLFAACKSDAPPSGAGDSGGGPEVDGGLPPPVIMSDQDMDGIDDSWEEMHGLDPHRNDASEDLDGDGISNVNEFNGHTLPNDIDTDDDGVGDGDEDRNKNGVIDPGETNPHALDTDGDGLTDGQELGKTMPLISPRSGIAGTDPAIFIPDANPATTTNPTNADTDGDGIPDGIEDRDHNGRVDVMETNPLDLDSDDDGITDGGEDVNFNGIVDQGELDPNKADTDGDGIIDGVEKGVTSPVVDPDGNGPLLGTDLTKWKPDADPTTMTDPLNPDSDGDGVLDGDEDWNHDGLFDPTQELNPSVGDTDGDGITDNNEGIAIVCSESALKQITLNAIASADITVALPPDYAELGVLRDANGRGVGLMFRSTTSGVVGFAISKTPEGPDAQAEAQVNRNRISGIATLSNQQDRALISWDGFQSVFTTANAAVGGINAVDLATQIATSVAQAGPLTGGVLSAGGQPGSFTVYFETILRQGRAIVVGALADEPTPEANIIALSDLANGTGVAQFGDFTGLGCDPFTSPPGNDVVDLLWIVDNSCSMETEQNNVAAAGNEMVSLLTTTSLSWRLGLMTTDPANAGNIGCCGVNGFTPSAPRAAAEQASRDWAAAVDALGTGGSGEEQGATLGITAVTNLLPGTPTEDPFHFRMGASVIVVHMSDEEDFTVKMASGGNDQSCPENAGKQSRITDLINGYLGLAQNNTISGLTTFAIHGIQPNNTGADYCDFNAGSGDCFGAAQHGRAYIDIANALGGGTGSICGDMSQVVQDIIRAGAGIASQIELTKPPISSTIRVVMADENQSFVGQPDVPRSRTNGFDYAFALDVMANKVQHKIVFYGTARPPSDRQLMISYRTWENGSPNPAGPDCDCLDGQRCNGDTNDCEIDPTCGGGCPQDMVCNPNQGLCQPDDPCDAMCGVGTVCNPDTAQCDEVDPCGGCLPGQYCNTQTNPPHCEGL